MNDRPKYRTSEVDDLKAELANFQREKERVRAVIGAIGGKPGPQTRRVTILLFILIGVAGLTAVIGGQNMRFLMVELTMLVLSIKIIYLIHCQTRLSHFKFWMLSSLEWRTSEIARRANELKTKAKQRPAGDNMQRTKRSPVDEPDSIATVMAVPKGKTYSDRQDRAQVHQTLASRRRTIHVTERTTDEMKTI